MLARSLLRDLVAGILLAAGLFGLAAVGHAQVAFWQPRPDGHDMRAARLRAGGWEFASARAESRDHVKEQIERMEARARADDRLSGRPAVSPVRDDERNRPPARGNQSDAERGNGRPSGVGPGWQAQGREGR